MRVLANFGVDYYTTTAEWVGDKGIRRDVDLSENDVEGVERAHAQVNMVCETQLTEVCAKTWMSTTCRVLPSARLTTLMIPLTTRAVFGKSCWEMSRQFPKSREAELWNSRLRSGNVSVFSSARE